VGLETMRPVSSSRTASLLLIIRPVLSLVNFTGHGDDVKVHAWAGLRMVRP
jgi:hypothetical protein